MCQGPVRKQPYSLTIIRSPCIFLNGAISDVKKEIINYICYVFQIGSSLLHLNILSLEPLFNNTSEQMDMVNVNNTHERCLKVHPTPPPPLPSPIVFSLNR